MSRSVDGSCGILARMRLSRIQYGAGRRTWSHLRLFFSEWLRDVDVNTRTRASDHGIRATKLYVGHFGIWPRVCGLGIDVSCNTRGNRVLPAAVVGWFSPSAHRFDFVSDLAVEDGPATDSSTLASVLCHWILAAGYREWRCVPCGAHGSIRG